MAHAALGPSLALPALPCPAGELCRAFQTHLHAEDAAPFLWVALQGEGGASMFLTLASSLSATTYRLDPGMRLS